MGYAFWAYDVESYDDLYYGVSDVYSADFLEEFYSGRNLRRTDLIPSGIFNPVEILAPFDTLYDGAFWVEMFSHDLSRLTWQSYSRNRGVINNTIDLALFEKDSDLQIGLKSYVGHYTTNRRTIAYHSRKIQLTVGNYLVSEGFGLTIGRFDNRPVAGFSVPHEFDFIYPINSMYNGVSLAVLNRNIKSSFYFSDKIYEPARNRFIGSSINYEISPIRVGVTLGHNSYANGSAHDEKLASGFNWSVTDELFNFGGEYAVINNSGGIYLNNIIHLDSAMLTLNYWNYANHFENYNCSAPAAIDYHSFYPDDSLVGFRSSQAGENGMVFGYNKKYWTLGCQLWKNSNETKLNSLSLMKFAFTIADSLSGLLKFEYSDKLRDNSFRARMDIRMRLIPLIQQTGVNLQTQGSKLFKQNAYVYLNCMLTLSDLISLGIKCQPYFNGHVRWFIGQDAYLTDNFRLIAEITISTGTRANIVIEKML